MKLIEERTLYSQKWTRLKEIRFLDRQGEERTWTYIERTNHQRAVVIVATTESTNSLILIRQFRVPFGRELIEFPAGLVDEGERPEDAATRELTEETGYEGVITEIGPEISTSAGITTETVRMVRMRVSEEPAGAQRLEGSERIDVMKIPPEEQGSFLEKMAAEQALFDAKVYVYLLEHREQPH